WGASTPIARALERHLPHAVEGFEGFWDGEIAPALSRSTPAPAVAAARGRVPRRLQNALPPPMRWLAAGWDDLDEPARARLLAIEAEIPGGSTALDLAWFACDGVRDVGEIADLLAREGWPVDAARLEEWFDLACALGLSAWVVR